MVILEAMAAGVPIITTAVGGIPEMLSSGEAHLCPPGDAAGLAASIDRVIQDPAGVALRASAARSRLDLEFGISPWVDRHQHLYRAALSR